MEAMHLIEGEFAPCAVSHNRADSANSSGISWLALVLTFLRGRHSDYCVTLRKHKFKGYVVKWVGTSESCPCRVQRGETDEAWVEFDH